MRRKDSAVANCQWPLTAELNHHQGCETLRPQIPSAPCLIGFSAGRSACLTGPSVDATYVSDCVMVFLSEIPKLNLFVLGTEIVLGVESDLIIPGTPFVVGFSVAVLVHCTDQRLQGSILVDQAGRDARGFYVMEETPIIRPYN